MKFLRYAIVSPLLASTLAGGAYAQSEAPQNSSVLEEIVVTAQKRREALQDVPLAITALTTDNLDKSRIQSSQDLQQKVPSLVYNRDSGYAQPFIRAIGSDLPQPNADASVATYIDGVYISNTLTTVTSLLGVERVEVVAGPQGTLYGRNAVGGAINIITLTPKQEFEGKAVVTLGDFSRREAIFSASGALTDKLSAGLYLAGTTRDSYKKSFFDADIPGQPDHETAWGARLKVVWRPSDAITLTATAEHSESRSFEASATRNVKPNGIAYVLFGSPQIFDRYLIVNNGADYLKNRIDAITLREEVDLGWASLLGISSYRKNRTRSGIDIDASVLPIIYANSRQDASQVSQEIQLISPDSNTVKWIAGLFYFRERGGFRPLTIRSDFILPPPIQRTDSYGAFTTSSYAAFAQATVNLSDNVRLTAGGRYTIDRKDFSGQLDAFDASGTTLSSVLLPDRDKKWKKFTPKISIDYRAGPTLLYATYSRGFKSGAYNTADPSLPGPVNPENLTSYEVGSKSDLLGGRLRLNSSAYYYDYKNLQVRIVDTVGGAPVNLLQNAGGAEAYGAELNLTYALTPELRVNAGGAWEKTKYKNFPAYAGVADGFLGNDTISVDVSGNRMMRAPKLTLTASIEYTKTYGDESEIYASLNGYHNSGFYWTPQNLDRQKAYNVVNASVGYTLPGGDVSISLWVTNLLDKYYLEGLAPTGVFGTYISEAAPRMVGATATYRFGAR